MIGAMLLRLRLLMITVGGGVALLVVLCLGAQNLGDRYRLNLGVGSTAPLPAGFVVGVSAVLGLLGGGSLTALLLPNAKR
ncbi:putative membrane protein [Synechococcus sp. PROS-7-1]|nr:putative membrane protein [Synechococcus sp. PROS-7-1]